MAVFPKVRPVQPVKEEDRVVALARKFTVQSACPFARQGMSCTWDVTQAIKKHYSFN
jgi:hypothetical protein